MTVLLLTLAVACLAIAALLIHRDCRAGIVVTPFLFFAASEIILVWPSGLQRVVLERPDPYPFAVMLGAFASFLIGNLTIRGIIAKDKGRATRYRAAPILYSDRIAERHYLIGMLALLLLTAAVGLHYYQGVPPVAQAIHELVQGGDRRELGTQVAVARTQLTKSHYFGGEYRGQGLATAVLQNGGAVLVGMFFLLWLKYRRRYWAGLTIVALGWSILLIAGDGERGPLVRFIVVLFALFTAVRIVTWRKAILAACATLLVFASLSLINNKIRYVPSDSNIFKATSTAVFNRFAYGTGSNNVMIMDLISEGKLDYERGAIHQSEFLAALPGIRPDATPFAHQLYLIRSAGGQRTTYATPTYLGKVYADFGPIGTWIVFIGLGMFVGLGQHLLLAERRSMLGLPLRALLIVAIGETSRAGITSVGPALVIGGVVFIYLWLSIWTSVSLSRGRTTMASPSRPLQALG